MEADEREHLAVEIDKHLLSLLRSNGTQAHAVAWMKTAYNLLEACQKDLRRKVIYSVHNGYGTGIYTVDQPKKLILPPGGLNKAVPPIWFEGKTVPYGDKFQNRAGVPWTRKDTERMIKAKAKR